MSRNRQLYSYVRLIVIVFLVFTLSINFIFAFDSSSIKYPCPGSDLFQSDVCSDPFFDTLDDCSDEECPNGICASNSLCVCMDGDIGKRLFASSLPFIPAVYKGTYDNYISYVEQDVPLPVVDSNNENILDKYYDSKNLASRYYDSQCYYEPERYYYISNGQDWFMCGSDNNAMGALDAITLSPGESPPVSTIPGSLEGVVTLSANDGFTGGSTGESSGTNIPQGSSSVAFVNVVDDNFFDGIYYGSEEGSNNSILVNQPEYGNIYKITDVNNGETFQCSDDGACISDCVLDPDCCDLDMNCSGNPCNPQLNGFCDPDCGFGADPDCAYNVDNNYWMKFFPTMYSCASEDNNHLWLQCCPNPNECKQKIDNLRGYNKISPYLPGDRIATLKEFPCESEFSTLDRSKNCALLFGFNSSSKDPVFPLYTSNSSYTLVDNQKSFIDITQSKLNITDWSEYSYLEFYISYFANFELDISIHGLVPGLTREKWPGSGTNSNDDVILFGPESVVNYAMQPPALKKWLHIKIPLGDENSILRQSKILRIELSADAETLDNIGTKVSYYPDPSKLVGQTKIPSFFELNNIIALDKVFLSHADPADDVICSGSLPSDEHPSSWINGTQFDTTDLDYQGVQLGMVACSRTPGYGWTGTQCCGDDQTKNFPTGSFTQETYIDTGSDACLFGNMIRNNSVLEIHVP